ncbi:hypothetical protein BH10ACT11_BH10ACT11_03790 [soil metagenome]
MPDEPQPEGAQRAFELAVQAITRRERTIAEMREWLESREVSELELEYTVDRLISIGELDDESYARRYAEDKRDLRGWGPERIRETLLSKGIPAATASAAAVTESHEEQIERATSLLKGRITDPSERSQLAKGLAFLGRRGYDYEVAYAAIRRVEREAA